MTHGILFSFLSFSWLYTGLIKRRNRLQWLKIFKGVVNRFVIYVAWNSLLVEGKDGLNLIFSDIWQYMLSNRFLAPFLLQPINQFLVIHALYIGYFQDLGGSNELFFPLCACTGKTEQMYNVIRGQAAYSGSKKHRFVIRMRSDEQNWVLTWSFVTALMEIQEDDGEEVKADENPLKREVNLV